ncbi:hypothetical protein P0Y67_01425 [Photobacterium sp. SP02]|uniref:hypothetical protein n=1 Tax=Photobacterium sp. SP02 TaxID=3032280 RepID=UPI003144DD7D
MLELALIYLAAAIAAVPLAKRHYSNLKLAVRERDGCHAYQLKRQQMEDLKQVLAQDKEVTLTLNTCRAQKRTES